MQRVKYIDGLRGLACMQVVLFHSDQFISFPLGLAANGPAGVSVFFLISGFVLTLAFVKSSQTIIDKIAARFIRLVLPSFISLVIAVLFLLARGRYHWQLLNSTSVGIIQCLTYHTLPALGPFTVITLNPPLWTICVELWGSMLILLLTECRHKSKPVHMVAMISGFFIPGINLLSLFVVGHFLAVVWHRQHETASNLATRTAGLTLLGAGGFVCQWRSLNPGLFGLLHLPNFAPYEVGATLIFCGALMLPLFQRLCSTRPLLFIGKISFPIYLLHWSLLHDLGEPIYHALFPAFDKWTGITTYVIVLTALILSAAVFQRYIDQTTRKVIFLVVRKRWPSRHDLPITPMKHDPTAPTKSVR